MKLRKWSRAAIAITVTAGALIAFQNMTFFACSSPGNIAYLSGNAQFCDGTKYLSMKNTAVQSCSAPGNISFNASVVGFCDGSTFWSIMGPAIGVCSNDKTIAWNGTVPTICVGGTLYSASTPTTLIQTAFQVFFGRLPTSDELSSILSYLNLGTVSYLDITTAITEALNQNPSLLHASDSTWTFSNGTWTAVALACSGGPAVNGACTGTDPYATDLAATRIFVSPVGSDASPGTLVSPFATVQHARDVARTLSASAAGDIIVSIRQGTYTVTSSILFTDADSGKNGHRVIYESFDGPGAAQFVGGQAIVGWTAYSGNIYRASVPAGLTFSDLYENGVRAVKARTPNIGSGYGTSTAGQGPWLKNITYNDTSTTQFRYSPGDFNAAGLNMANLQVNIYPGGYYNWDNQVISVAAIDSTNQIVTLAGGTAYDLKAGSRYFIENDLSLLDAPGEFFLDTSSSAVYYYSRTNAINSQSIIAPATPVIFSVIGSSPTTPATNLIFDGLAFTGTDYRYTGGGQGAMLSMINTFQVSVRNSHFKDAGLNGIEMLGYNKSNTIFGNYIENIGAYGVLVQGDTSYSATSTDENRDHLIQNNRIEFIGMHDAVSAGIWLTNSGHNEISHNSVKYGPRILVGGGTQWDAPDNANFFGGNNFAYNTIYSGVEDSADAGAMYFWGPNEPGQPNTIQQTVVDTVVWDPNSNLHVPPNYLSFPTDGTYNIPGFGIYFDDQSSGWIVQHVSVVNAAYQNQDNGGGQSLTDVSWSPGFTNSLDYANIGLLPSFPTAY